MRPSVKYDPEYGKFMSYMFICVTPLGLLVSRISSGNGTIKTGCTYLVF